MGRVVIYEVKVWDHNAGDNVISRRMATSEGALIMKVKSSPSTGAEIDTSQLERGEQWTPLDFDP